MLDKDFMDFIDEVLPKMTKKEQRQMKQQVTKWADEDSRRLAKEDPLSRIPMA